MEKIKFGTDGWRGIIANEYTIENVARISLATAQWLTRKFKNPSAVIGFDCRFGGEMFMEAAAKILASKGIRVYISERFVTTPMVSLAIRKLKAQCGIVITASHNPPDYNGFKLRGEHGGPMFEKDLKDVENLISNDLGIDLELLNWNSMLEQGLIQYIDLEGIYIKEVHDNFDVSKLADSGLKFACDAMYGSSQNLIKKLLPFVHPFHCEVNPGFKGIPPDPIRKNLHELAELVWKAKDIDASMAVDGDGDRIAMFDRDSNFIDANLILLLLIHYLAGYKRLTGKVVAGFSSTGKLEIICKIYGLSLSRSKIGFKEISKMMTEEPVLIAGEESGGIGIGNHIPERDAVWAGMLVWQFMMESGKSLKELVQEVLSITGPFAFEKANVELNRNLRNKVSEKCKNAEFTNFGRFNVMEHQNIDGCKFFFSDHEWLMIRLSGTEPLVRLYAEAETSEIAQEILFSAMKVIMEV